MVWYWRDDSSLCMGRYGVCMVGLGCASYYQGFKGEEAAEDGVGVEGEYVHPMIHDIEIIGMNANPPMNKAITVVFWEYCEKIKITTNEEDVVDTIRYFVEPYWALSLEAGLSTILGCNGMKDTTYVRGSHKFP